MSIINQAIYRYYFKIYKDATKPGPDEKINPNLVSFIVGVTFNLGTGQRICPRFIKFSSILFKGSNFIHLKTVNIYGY